jgi:hypothetical protein
VDPTSPRLDSAETISINYFSVKNSDRIQEQLDREAIKQDNGAKLENKGRRVKKSIAKQTPDSNIRVGE